MSRRQPSSRERSSPTSSATRTVLILLAMVVIGTIITILMMQPDHPRPVTRPGAAPSGAPSTALETNPPSPTPAPAAPVANPNLQPLLGRWLRTDGNYLVVIDRIDPNGEMRAGYFNPRPIKVSRAEAFEKDGKAKMYLELRDEGYPGSFYDLEFSPTNDGLAGRYFQATLRETYDVEFVRMK